MPSFTSPINKYSWNDADARMAAVQSTPMGCQHTSATSHAAGRLDDPIFPGDPDAPPAAAIASSASAATTP